MDWAEDNETDYIFGLAGNAVLDALVAEIADNLRFHHAMSRKAKLRTFASFMYQATSWKRPRKVVARLECSLQPVAGETGMRQEVDIRYIVTSLDGSAQHLYENIYCQRGQMENLIKLHKAQLSSDRMSCHSATANQVRLVLHTAAFWLMHGVRAAIPRTEPARRRRVRDDPRAPDQDWCARDRARRAHSHSPADQLPGSGIVPNRSTRPAPIRPVNCGASRPNRAAARGRSTPNASYNEWHHTDQADRTAGARSINSPEKRATSCIIAANYPGLDDGTGVRGMAGVIERVNDGPGLSRTRRSNACTWPGAEPEGELRTILAGMALGWLKLADYTRASQGPEIQHLPN